MSADAPANDGPPADAPPPAEAPAAADAGAASAAAAAPGKTAAAITPSANAALAQPPAKPEEEKQVKTAFAISRLEMLEYINVRAWWTRGQTALIFTFCLWASFVYIVWIRTDVVASQEVHFALQRYLRNVVAHPSIGGVEPKSPDQMPVQCRCACQGAKRGTPKGPCGGRESTTGTYPEVLDFEGRLPLTDAQILGVQSGGGDKVPIKRWDDIATVEDAWYWIEYGLLPEMWKPSGGRVPSQKPGKLLSRNVLIGGLRIRQMRAKVATACDVDATLLQVYPVKCRDTTFADSMKQPTGLDANIASDKDVILAYKNAKDSSGTPVLGAFDANMDIGRDLYSAQQLASALRKHAWYDDMTRSLQVDALFLNPEVGCYARLEMFFELPEGGGLVKRMRVRTLPAIDGASLSVIDFVWGGLIAVLVLQEAKQILWSFREGQLREYFSDFWNLLDWFSIAFGVPVVLYWFVVASASGALNVSVVGLPLVPSANIEQYRTTWTGFLDTSLSVLVSKYYHQLCLFWYACLITGRFLKNAMSQQKLATLQLALGQSIVDVCHFLAIYITLFANFVVGGRILFGSELEEWSSFSMAASTSVRMLMGHFQFERLTEVAPYVSSVWFWFFLMSMIFVLSNLLLSIIIDHWVTFRKLVGKTPSILRDAQLGWKDFVWRCEWRYESVKDGEYKEALGNPYDGLVDELLEKAKADERLETAQRVSSLGCRLVRRHMESKSLDGLADDGSAGGVAVTGLELRRMGCDPMTAQHLLQECEEFLKSEKTKETSALDQVRQLGKLIRKHKKQLEKHCQNIEEGVEEDREHLWQGLKRLERSVRASLENFSSLRYSGVDTLAPPLHSESQHFRLENRKDAPLDNDPLRLTASVEEDMQLQLVDG